MPTLHMTEAEVARDLHAVLEEVQRGVEVVIEDELRPIAILTPPVPSGRPIDDVLEDLEASGSDVILDEEFGKDLEEIIALRRQPWNPPSSE